MKKFGILLGCFVVFSCMLTASFVFADAKETPEKKSYYVETPKNDQVSEKDLVLTTSLEKKITTSEHSYNYSLDIVDGNVVLTNLNSGSKEKVYSKGDAKYLTEVNFYYYDSAYLLVITEDGKLYANIYSNKQNRVKFREIKTNNEVSTMKVVEKTQRFYDYPAVELFGLNANGDWELIRL